MVICWSCEKAAGDGIECAHCGALQPARVEDDHFRVLGVERRFDLDIADLERRYRELTRKLHPDRFARADARARRASLGRSVQLNEAWKALKDPVRRAEYLVQLGRGDAGEKDAVPPALLAEILELRQELGEARLEGDDAKVQAMAADMRGRVDAGLARVGQHLAASELDAAAHELVALRYYRRFLDEVAVHEEAVATRTEGGLHG